MKPIPNESSSLPHSNGTLGSAMRLLNFENGGLQNLRDRRDIDIEFLTLRDMGILDFSLNDMTIYQNVENDEDIIDHVSVFA